MKSSDIPTIYIIGAGLAGLSAAVSLVQHKKWQIVVYEASGEAGGRCRSYFDSSLGCVIDNGNHLALSMNKHLRAYVGIIGAESTLKSLPGFDVIDVKNQKKRTINTLKLCPWWLQNGLFFNTTAVKLFLESIFNTPRDTIPDSAILKMGSKLLMAGNSGVSPILPKDTLSDSLITPALEYLKKHGAKLHFHQRLKRIESIDTTAKAIHFSDETIELGSEDRVILCVPCHELPKFLPTIKVPTEFHPIVNVHFKMDTSMLPVITGLIHAKTHWIFAKNGVLSTTTSAASTLSQMPEKDIAKYVWHEIKSVFQSVDNNLPPYRVIKEKRATFATNRASLSLRPGNISPLNNVFIAGDFTDNGLPATMEGAVLSGKNAANAVIKTV